MKSLKVIIAAVALSVMASAPFAQAQEKKGAMTPEQQIARIEQAVGSLTAAQKEKITAIFAKGREEMQQIPKEERKDKMGPMMKKQREQVSAVLTPDQRKKYEAMAKEGGGSGGGKKKKN